MSETGDVAERHTCMLGRVVSNLQSLEFLLRTFLLDHDGGGGGAVYEGLNKGDRIAEDAFTNYDSLMVLISKYNTTIAQRDPSLRVDDAVVDLRDALAHGRVASDDPTSPMGLLKFSKPRQGQVTVTFAATMDDTWYTAQVQLTSKQMLNVVLAGKSLNMTTSQDTDAGSWAAS